MIKKIRGIIDRNRSYAWMVVFVMLVQAGLLVAGEGKAGSKAGQAVSAEEFKQSLQHRQDALRQAIIDDPHLAANLGVLSMFIMVLLITGTVFLIDYIISRRKEKKGYLTRTLDTPEPLWSPADVLKVIIITVFLSHLFLVLAGLLSSLFGVKAADRRSDIIVSTVFIDTVIFLLVLTVVTKKYNQGIKALGLSLKNLARNIGIALYAYIGFLPVLAAIFFAVLFTARVLNYTPPPQPIYELIFEEDRSVFLFIITAMVSAAGPFIEEVFFRGFLYAALKKSLGISSGIFLSALLFSLLHTNPLGFIPILALGIFLAYLREKTGSLIPSIAVHITHNAALTCAMFFLRGIT